MARYNRVKIGDIYLTSDGLVTGKPCKTTVTGLDRLQQSLAGIIRLAADGEPYEYTMPNAGKGIAISVRPAIVMKTVLESIKAEHEDGLTAGTINIVIEGDTGDFDLQCKVQPSAGIEFPGTFHSERIDGVVLNYVIQSINPPEEPEP